MSNRFRLPIALAALALVLGARTAAATDSLPPPAGADATFGSRTDRPDGSAAVTFGRRLPTEWESKVGADVSLAAPAGTAASDHLLRRGAADRSSGAVWGNLAMPGAGRIGLDRASVEARIDAGNDEGKIGATVSRSVPINPNLSVTLQNIYSVKESLAGASPVPTAATAPAAIAPASTWSMDETVRVSVDPFGTTISAGAGSSVADSQWHNRLSVEQTLYGPLKLTTSLEDAGTAAPKKSISAGFKRTW
jgi:hypothetical protein